VELFKFSASLLSKEKKAAAQVVTSCFHQQAQTRYVSPERNSCNSHPVFFTSSPRKKKKEEFQNLKGRLARDRYQFLVFFGTITFSKGEVLLGSLCASMAGSCSRNSIGPPLTNSGRFVFLPFWQTKSIFKTVDPAFRVTFPHRVKRRGKKKPKLLLEVSTKTFHSQFVNKHSRSKLLVPCCQSKLKEAMSRSLLVMYITKFHFV
jgi:hypothetical protein